MTPEQWYFILATPILTALIAVQACRIWRNRSSHVVGGQERKDTRP